MYIHICVYVYKYIYIHTNVIKPVSASLSEIFLLVCRATTSPFSFNLLPTPPPPFFIPPPPARTCITACACVSASVAICVCNGGGGHDGGGSGGGAACGGRVDGGGSVGCSGNTRANVAIVENCDGYRSASGLRASGRGGSLSLSLSLCLSFTLSLRLPCCRFRVSFCRSARSSAATKICSSFWLVVSSFSLFPCSPWYAVCTSISFFFHYNPCMCAILYKTATVSCKGNSREQHNLFGRRAGGKSLRKPLFRCRYDHALSVWSHAAKCGALQYAAQFTKGRGGWQPWRRLASMRAICLGVSSARLRPCDSPVLAGVPRDALAGDSDASCGRSWWA